MEELIKVVQLPVIEEQLLALKEDIRQKTADASAMVCTMDTIQTVKQTRADLNKLFNSLEEQRKEVKRAVMERYNAFDATYKECVTYPFSEADTVLKSKISEVEQVLKDECEQEIRGFFSELCEAEHVDWLTYERMGLNITLTDARQKTHKSLREKVGSFVVGISQAVTAISEMENADEIMAEYKQSLSLPAAVGAVSDRHRRIQAEKEAAERRRAAQEAQRASVEKVEAVYTSQQEKPLQPPTEVVVAPEKVYKTSFTVHGTKEQLVKLKQFMEKEGIRYE